MKKLILLLIVPFIFISCVSKSNNENYDDYDWKRISPLNKTGLYVFRYEGHEYMIGCGTNSTPIHTENCKNYDDSLRKINTKNNDLSSGTISN